MASRWAVDPRGSRISFTAGQLGVAVKGTFTCVKGELSIDRQVLERSTAHIAIDASSLETALPAFAAILEAKDYLDVEHHPTIEFQSRTIFRSGERYFIAGELSFRGERREVRVDADLDEFLTEGENADTAASEVARNLAQIRGRTSLKGLVADEDLEVTIELTAVPAEAWGTADVDADQKLDPRSTEQVPIAGSNPSVTVEAGAADAGLEPDGVAAEPLAAAERPVRILGLAGSYRSGSHNQSLLRAAIEVAPPGVSIELFDLRDLPFYDVDLEAAGDPPEVMAFREAIAASDALLIATPEYNRGLPARIKNAIDWASRPPFASPLVGKPVALIGASTGRSGAANAVAHAREALAHAHAQVIDQTVAVPRAHAIVDAEGNVTDPAVRRELARIVRELAEAAVSAAERAA